jgi:hypothetical protein
MIYERGIAEYYYRTVAGPQGYGRRKVVDFVNNIECYPAIRFVGLFDTVGSFGIPGNNINIGIRMDLPPNVRHAAHAIARDERRTLFQVTLLNDALPGQDFSQSVFTGDHSDIGGGHEEDQNLLALAPLFYVWSAGRAVGVPFGPLNLIRDSGRLFLEVNGERRPWSYKENAIPHDMTELIRYTDGGPRQNLSEGSR